MSETREAPGTAGGGSAGQPSPAGDPSVAELRVTLLRETYLTRFAIREEVEGLENRIAYLLLLVACFLVGYCSVWYWRTTKAGAP